MVKKSLLIKNRSELFKDRLSKRFFFVYNINKDYYMDTDKLVALKANVKRMEYISLADIKMLFSTDDQEAQELLDKVIQCGLVQPYPIDGVHFKVNR